MKKPNKNTLLILVTIFVIAFSSCTGLKKDRDELIQNIEVFKRENNRYPKSLNEVPKSKGEYCYYSTEESFNIEYTLDNDLYWYNSGNKFWDFLEGDADKLYCN